MGIGPAAGLGRKDAGVKRKRKSQVLGREGFGALVPMHQPAPIHWSQNSIASAYVRWDMAKIGKDCTLRKCRDVPLIGNAPASKRFQHHKEHDRDHDDRGYLIDYPKESSRAPVLIGAENLNPSGEKSMHSR